MTSSVASSLSLSCRISLLLCHRILMAVSLTDLKRSRTSAKRDVGRVEIYVKAMLKAEVRTLDLEALQAQSEALETADEAFQQYHDEIFDQDEHLDETQYISENQQHHSSVSWVRLNIKMLKAKLTTFELLSELEDALSQLEINAKDGPLPSILTDLSTTKQLNQQFRKVTTHHSLVDDDLFREARKGISTRLQAAERLCERAVPPSIAADSAPAKPLRFISQNLKVDLPQFDGTMLKWRDFWHLFSAVLSKHDHLDDHKKNCLLLKAMGSPEAREKAEAAIAYTSSYAEVSARLRENYELNRELHTHHLAELLLSDLNARTWKDCSTGWRETREV